MSSSEAFLPPGLLERVGGLDLITRRIVRGVLQGAHRSRLRGAGEDFARHRDYQQGDDVRHLDWRLYGRTDRLYIRQFEERSNLQAYIVLDASASMDFAAPGGLTKSRYAAYVAAALAHLMLSSGDAVGLATFGVSAELVVPPRARRGQLHDLLTHLERSRPLGEAGAATALDRVGGALRRGGRIILISDLLEEDDGAALAAAAGRLRARGDEVMVLRVLTPTEIGETAPGPGRFYDPERPTWEIPAAPSTDPGYAARVAEYYAALAASLRGQGVEYVPLSTADPVETALLAWLGARARAA